MRFEMTPSKSSIFHGNIVLGMAFVMLVVNAKE